MTRDTARESGFTMVELVVVMSIVGVLMAIATFGFTSYRNTSEQRGSAQEMLSALRSASEQAISEGRTYCVDLAAGASGNRTYSTWRKACTAAGGGTQVGGTKQTQSARVTFTSAVTSPSPAPACAAGHSCIYFYPRGTALPATVTVASSARSKTYTIRVEGLTARVYM